MSQGLADSLRGERCVVVNDCYQLAPWAEALCAQDHAWWKVHPDAMQFAGRKFSANRIQGVEQVHSDYVQRPSSSGVLALEVARRLLAGTADRQIDLHGFDNRGTHYFGPHPEPLRNTSEERFKVFEQQLAALGGEMKKAGIRIINRTPGSALRCFPIVAGSL
jgi:hypothetical protein